MLMRVKPLGLAPCRGLAGVRCPHRLRARRQWHRKGIQQVRNQGVVAAQRHQLDDALLPEEAASCVEAGLADLSDGGEFAGHRIDGALVVSVKGWLLALPDRIDDGVGDAVLAGHTRVRPPLEFRFPASPDGDDRDFAEPALDGGVEAQDRAKRSESSPYLRRTDERVEWADQGAV